MYIRVSIILKTGGIAARILSTPPALIKPPPSPPRRSGAPLSSLLPRGLACNDATPSHVTLNIRRNKSFPDFYLP
ncbi:hypothetical protein E2C01_046169 [Portunus trituberculatus]|uniref:Uncharacterized protein n=1 Tax=Portunus trituberculatus TaxID=210409 RepID=A0A5B7G3N7_PORTR|nr:hypothetical protein [Portunus trituberculatus]